MEAYQRQADRFVAATISDRTVGTATAPANPRRTAWATEHGGTLVADTFPTCDSAAYGIYMLTEPIVEARPRRLIHHALTCGLAGNHPSHAGSGNI